MESISVLPRTRHFSIRVEQRRRRIHFNRHVHVTEFRRRCRTDDVSIAIVASARHDEGNIDFRRETCKHDDPRSARLALAAWRETPQEVFVASGWSGVRRAAVAAVHRACDAADQWEPGLGALLAEDARRSRMLDELQGALAMAGAAHGGQGEWVEADNAGVEAGQEGFGVVRNGNVGEGEQRRMRGGGGAAAVIGGSGEVPLLLGVPVAVKDLIHVRGFPTGAGALPGFPALDPVLRLREGEMIRRLRSAGAVILGKAAMTEFAYRQPAHTRNPRAPSFTPGGSSSGSAAAVAAGICPLALASQTCASISRPAAFTATVGFKPSHHRVPSSGCISPSPSLDQFGVISASVRWAALWAQAVLPHWRTVPHTEGTAAGPWCVAVPEGPLLEQCEGGTARDEFQKMLTQLRASSAWRVVSLPCLNDLLRIKESHLALMAHEYAAFLDSLALPHLPSVVSPALLELIVTGRNVTEEEVTAARASCLELRHRLQQQLRLAGADAFIAPAATGYPPPLIQGTTGDPIMSLPWSHAGLPTVTIPLAVTPATITALEGGMQEDMQEEGSTGALGKEHLPLGVTLVGMWNEDEKLMQIALELEEFIGVDG